MVEETWDVYERENHRAEGNTSSTVAMNVGSIREGPRDSSLEKAPHFK